jgi:hypothetical protein
MEVTAKQMKAFFDDAVGFALSAKGAPTSLLEAMEKHGLAKELPKPLAEHFGPMFKASMADLKNGFIPHNCNWCGVCSICDGWIPAQGSHSAHLLKILDFTYTTLP